MMRLAFCAGTILMVVEGSSSASSIRGGVVDEPTGELMPGAQVTVKDQRNPAFTRNGKTNSRGEFRFSKLPAGEYVVTATACGCLSDSTKVTLADYHDVELRKNILQLRNVESEFDGAKFHCGSRLHRTLSRLRRLVAR
jgi:hypothetical protein